MIIEPCKGCNILHSREELDDLSLCKNCNKDIEKVRKVAIKLNKSVKEIADKIEKFYIFLPDPVKVVNTSHIYKGAFRGKEIFIISKGNFKSYDSIEKADKSIK